MKITDQALKTARIMIVDDEAANVMLLEHILEHEGFHNLESLSDSRLVLPRFLERQPDLILLDLRMPHLTGFDVIDQLHPYIDENQFLPIVMLTADVTSNAKACALEKGVADFLTKPIDYRETLLRVRNLLRTHFLQLRVAEQNQALEDRVRERTQDLQISQLETLERLALAAEYRDDDTGQHVQRVSNNCALLAAALGWNNERIELLRKAAPLHDVGKIGIPDDVLLKPAKLTPEEWDLMKSHTVIGARILSGSRFPLLQMAESIALTHHEKWDGTGYTPGIAGEEIPLEGRVVAVADVFDALTHERPYKRAWPVDEAVREIQSLAGRHFDPSIVEAFSTLPHDTMI